MKLIIIDGNSLINRAYYAMPKPMITKNGLYTHGVYGFINMLNRMITDYSPDYMAIAFDKKAPTFRHLEYAEYKAGRKKMPPELAMQLPLLKEVLSAMKIKVLEMDGFEADDIIGTIAKRAEENKLEPVIVTGDKDELQLASEMTKVVITKKGISQFELYDKEAMLEKYGFTPEQFIDYKGLMGDSSDNIPGIPGVGEKTAQKLILQFGTIANLLNNLDEVSNAKLRDRIEEHAQVALMSRRLATINTEVPIDIDFEEFKMEEPDYNELISLYAKLEFNSLLKKLKIPESYKATEQRVDASDLVDGALETSADTVNEMLVQQESDLSLLEKDLKEDSSIILKVFSDHNHKDLPLIYGISIMSNKNCYYIKGTDREFLEQLKDMMTRFNVRISGHNLKNDYYVLMANDLVGNWDEKNKGTLLDTAFDTAVAQYLLEPARSNYDLSTMLLEYYHEDLPSEAEFMKENAQIDFLSDTTSDANYMSYGTKWCLAVNKIRTILEEKLKTHELESVYIDIELPLIEVLASMEYNGFAVDRKELTDAGEKITIEIEKLKSKIYELAGEEFNINSPAQLGVILFEKLGLPAGKKTKRGYSTSVEVLDKLKDDYEIVQLILEYRMHAKLNGTYIEGMLPLIHKDNKIHAHFQQTVAATGRISCTEPNLQNIPIRHELGRRLRKAFVPESPDYILVGADYSQIELRVLAHMSEDPTLIDAFNREEDIHKITASKIFGIPEDQVTSLQRSNAKAVNFGVIYGMSGFGLSKELNITRKKAEQYIDEYFKKYAMVESFMKAQVELCKANGYVTTIMNRKRFINDINARNYMARQAAERLAMNSPIQGSAADIIKIAMVEVYRELNKRRKRSKLILQVHDELIIHTHKDELEAVKKLLVDSMENAVKLKVKLSVDLDTGNNWYELG
ncbi:MAG: DNA polymerase I [Anaerovoracaceae bacterium]|jgi:DNA polymerase-1